MGNSNLSSTNSTLRLRVFAGPNGSGKSTVIQHIRNYKTRNRNIDFGIYINADDIAQKLRDATFTFNDFEISTTNQEFKQIALSSGLINVEFNETTFINSYSFKNDVLKLKNKNADEHLAQIIADFLRKKLLGSNKKFSFETVFSHSSKLDIMYEAAKRVIKFTCISYLLNLPKLINSEFLPERRKVVMMCLLIKLKADISGQ